MMVATEEKIFHVKISISNMRKFELIDRWIGHAKKIESSEPTTMKHQRRSLFYVDFSRHGLTLYRKKKSDVKQPQDFHDDYCLSSRCTYASQCGNLVIFLSLDFTWNQFLGIQEVQNCKYCHFIREKSWNFRTVCLSILSFRLT